MEAEQTAPTIGEIINRMKNTTGVKLNKIIKVMGMRFELMLINFRDLEDSITLTTQPTHQYNYISSPLYNIVPF